MRGRGLTLRRRRLGIALFLTLLTCTVLLLLVGAFFQVNRNQLQLRRNDSRAQKAQQAALSGLEYARMRLEVNRRWGTPDSTTDRTIHSPGLTIYEEDHFGSGPSPTFCCVGVLDDGESHFQINLVTPGTVLPTSGFPQSRVSDSDIAAHREGPLSRWGRVTLPSPDISLNYLIGSGFEAPLLASQGRAPFRSVRSATAMLQIRGFCAGTVRTLDISLAAERPTDSAMHAGGNLAIDVDGRWNLWSLNTNKNRIEAGSGILLKGSQADRPSLSFWSPNGDAASSGQIQVSDGLAEIRDQDDGSLAIVPRGTPQNIDVARAGAYSGGTYRPSVGVSSVNDLTPGQVETQLHNPGYQTVSLTGGSYELTAPNTLKGPGGQVYVDKIQQNGQVVARIEKSKVIFSKGLHVNFSGPTTIEAPIQMGYDTSVANQAWLPANSDGTFLKVDHGNLEVKGAISGAGSVMATGNATDQGSVLMMGRSQLASEPDSAVTIYAERNIKMSAPDPTTARFFSTDLSAIAQGLESYAQAHTRYDDGDVVFDPWKDGRAPINEFANLGPDQDNLTQGGETPVPDTEVSSSTIKTSPISQSSAVKAALIDQFTVLNDPDEDYRNAAQAEFDRFYSQLTAQGGLTVGRYLRMREFLREMEMARRSGDPMPSSDLNNPTHSLWADPAQMNEVLNDQLKAEISYFHRKANIMGHNGQSMKRLNEDTMHSSPTNNPLTSIMDSRDAKWTGLLYARGSIVVDTGRAGPNDSVLKGALDVRGSMIARYDMAVANVTGITTVYDPYYLRALSEFHYAGLRATKLWTDFYRMR